MNYLLPLIFLIVILSKISFEVHNLIEELLI